MNLQAIKDIRDRLEIFDFFRFKILPAAANLEFYCRKYLAEKKDFSCIDDLKTEASARHWTYTPAAPTVIQESVPSQCLPEDALEIVKHGKLIRRKHKRRNQDPDYLDRMLLANLISVKRYPVYETFTCEVPEAIISAPNGAALTANYEAIIQSTRLIWPKVIMAQVPEAGSCLKGTYVSLLGGFGQNYSHWLIDILVRMALVPEGASDLFFLISDPSAGYKWQSLEVLGIPRERIVPLPPGWHRLENLLICHAAQRSMVPKKQHLTVLRERLMKGAFGLEKPAPPWRRVYVSRSKVRRRIVNEENILPIIKEYGFEIIFPEDLSFREQVRIFAETKDIMAPHGGGLFNQCLSDPLGTVIEIYNPRRYNWDNREVANVLGQKHWFSYGENVNHMYDMKVDPKKVAKLLDYAFGKGAILESIY